MITALVDVMPLSGNPLLPADHGDFLVAGAVVSPLLGSRTGVACAELAGRDRRGITMHSAGRRWSDGRPFGAYDLLTSFLDPVVPRWAEVATVHMDGEVIRASWTLDQSLLLAMLRLPDWAPRRGSSNPFTPGAPALGPYRVSRLTDSEAHLEPNLYHNDAGTPVRLMVEPDPVRGVDRYLRGDVDLTCGTTMTAELLASLSGHPDLVTLPSSIRAYLEFGAASALDRDARRDLARAIGSYDLTRATQGVMAPVSRTSDLRGSTDMRQAADMTVIFPDFEPNSAIVAAIAEACESVGCAVTPIALDMNKFTARMLDGNFEAAYVLQPDHLGHPIFEIGPWESSSRYARSRGFASPLLDVLIAEGLASGDSWPWREAARHLVDLVPRVPVGRTLVNYLSRVGTSIANFDHHGCPRFDTLSRKARCK